MRFAQWTIPAKYRDRAIAVDSRWNSLTVLNSTRYGWRRLYTQIWPKSDLKNKLWRYMQLPVWLSSCLPCQMPFVPRNGMSFSIPGWQRPRVRLWMNPNIPMSRRKVGGAKLWSRKATSAVRCISSKDDCWRRSMRERTVSHEWRMDHWHIQFHLEWGSCIDVA